MRFSEARSSLAMRLRNLPIWSGALAFYLPYTIANIREELALGSLTTPWAWGYRLIVPWFTIAGAVWVSPFAWEWDGRPGGRPAPFALRALGAALACEAWMVVITCVVVGFRWKMGASDLGWSSLRVFMTFQGPIIFFVGGLIAAHDRLAHENRQVKETAREAQGRLLQGQMNPHILFNAFNGLAELVVRDPRAAERSIRSLAGLMRKLLDATERSAYSLDEERALVEDYLAAEALRLGARLRVDWTWDEGLGDLPFIPLLLQPLVENAIKHGIALTEGGGDLRLGASMEGARLRLEVRNTGQAPPPAIREGVGLRNLRSRLSWAYGDAAGVALRREGDWTVARMWLEPYLISHLPTETTHGHPQDRLGG